MSNIIKKMLPILLPLNGMFWANITFERNNAHYDPKYILFKNMNILFFNMYIAYAVDYMLCWVSYMLSSLSDMLFSEGSITCRLRCITLGLTNIHIKKKNIHIFKKNTHYSPIWVNTLWNDFSLEDFNKYTINRY